MSTTARPTRQANGQSPRITRTSATGIMASAEAIRSAKPDSRLTTRCPVASLAPPEFADRLAQAPLIEIRPVDRHEHQLGIGELPEHEVAQPLLAAGPDQEIRIGQPQGVQGPVEQILIDLDGLDLACRGLHRQPTRGVRDLATAAVV